MADVDSSNRRRRTGGDIGISGIRATEVSSDGMGGVCGEGGIVEVRTAALSGKQFVVFSSFVLFAT